MKYLIMVIIFSMLASFSHGQLMSTTTTHTPLTFGSGVMLQGFYWNTQPLQAWWSTLQTQLPTIAAAGFDSIWLPPPSKGASGINSMGYDPYDYYDLGNYNQKSTIATRFGTQDQLVSLIKAAHADNIGMIADVVLNHNSGGASEWNPIANAYTYTDFMNIASGLFPRNYTDFHPCATATADSGSFGGFPDLCHSNPAVDAGLEAWGKWLRDTVGYDGWRFDYVKGYPASVVTNWMKDLGGWGVAEYWDGNKDNVLSYLSSENNTVSAFDFPLLYKLHDMAMSNGTWDMNQLRNVYSVMTSQPFHSVTFVANHDTVRDQYAKITQNRLLAYAFILTAEGYPCVFYQDYFNQTMQPALNTLIHAHNAYAKGGTTVLYTDQHSYIAQRDGDPGLIVMMNDSPTQWLGYNVTSKFRSTTLVDITGQAYNEPVDANGKVEIWAPPMGYTVYVPEYALNSTSSSNSSSILPTTSNSGTLSATTSGSTPTTTETTSSKSVAPVFVITTSLLAIVSIRYKHQRQ